MLSRHFLLILLLSAVGQSVVAQYEGLLRYQIKYEENGIESLTESGPTALTYYFSKNGAKLVPEGDSIKFVTTIYRFGKKENSIYLLSTDGKSAAKLSENEIPADENNYLFKEVLDLEEKIGKFNCKKYLLETTHASYEIWTTDEISIDKRIRNFQGFLPLDGLSQLNGFPVKIVESVPGYYTKTFLMDQHLEVAVASSEFELKDGCEIQEMSLQEYQNQ